jgi:hypothetical protein
MKTFATLVAALTVGGTFLLAHNGNEHVRGVVTQITPQAITVQTTSKATRTIGVAATTAVKRAGKEAHLSDLKIGDRVVVDVPAKKNEALQIDFAPRRR